MKTLLITCHSVGTPCHELAKITIPNMRKYAERHGYDFKALEADPNKAGNLACLEFIKSALETYSTVFFIGADVLIMNHQIEINQEFEFAPLTISKERISWWPINNDVCIWKQSPFSVNLLQRLLDDIDAWMSYKWLWQQHLWNLIQTTPWIKNSVRIEEVRKLQSTVQQTESAWQLGDFIIHLLDMEIPEKIRLANKLLPMAGDCTHYAS